MAQEAEQSIAHQGISASSQAFLEAFSPEFSLRALPHLIRREGQLRTVPESPRIIGKLHFAMDDAERFAGLSHPPQTLSELQELVAQGVLDCVNGDKILQYQLEWEKKYTNAHAEENLRAATLSAYQREGSFSAFPVTMRQRKGKGEVPEIIFLDTANCLSPSEPTSTRFFNNVIVGNGLVDPDDTVLDMCAGSAITSLVCGYMMNGGNGHVYAMDLMPEAVDTATRNVAMHKLDDKVTVLQSDMFGALPEGILVDKLFINPPFNPKTDTHHETSEGLMEAVQDFRYEVVSRLFEEGAAHMKPGGKMYVLYEDLKEFPGGKNAIEWFVDTFNQTHEQQYHMSTLARTRRARVNSDGSPMNITFEVYEITFEAAA